MLRLPRTNMVRVITVTLIDPAHPTSETLGGALDAALKNAGVERVRHRALRGEGSFIKEFVEEAAGQNEADALILFGGTGIGPRDQTPEALVPLLEKHIDGFAEEFHRLYFEVVGPRASFERVMAGVYCRCLVYALPEDEQGALLALEKLVLPTLRLAVDLANGILTAK
jgi:molybdenum cofactor biosynthesis protein B